MASMYCSTLNSGMSTSFAPAVSPCLIALSAFLWYSGAATRITSASVVPRLHTRTRRVLVWSRGTTDADVILVAAPLYHKNALNAIKQGLTAGAKLVLMPEFNVEQYIDAIGRYGATIVSGVPTMMSMVLARGDI